LRNELDIAAVNRCAAQNQVQNQISAAAPKTNYVLQAA
jgi:hypothetical protein